MTVERVEFFVEEPSMEAFLRGFLPRFMGDINFEVYPFSSKNELLRKLPRRLQAYSSWIPPTWRIVVLVDRDQDDCHKLKKRLEDIASNTGLSSRTETSSNYFIVNRIVIEELEAWYFGDWEAVQAAYPRVPRNVNEKSGYRDPDAIKGGTWEAFEREMQRRNYFEGGLQKISAARAISEKIEPERNRSRSFQVFYNTLAELAAVEDSRS